MNRKRIDTSRTRLVRFHEQFLAVAKKSEHSTLIVPLIEDFQDFALAYVAVISRYFEFVHWQWCRIHRRDCSSKDIDTSGGVMVPAIDLPNHKAQF